MKTTPLYKVLTQQLIKDIQHHMSVNDLLPSERKLSENTNYSRTTVRLAMKELEKLGYTKTVHGKGHIVVNTNPTNYDLGSMYSFSDHMTMLGNKPTTKILRLELIKASEATHEIIGSKDDDQVILLKRLRLANNVPMLLEFTYLPAAFFPNIENILTDTTGLYATLLNEYDTHIQKAEDHMHARIANDLIAKHLEIEVGDPVIEIRRQTVDAEHRLIEYTVSYAQSDNFSYRITHTR